MNSIAPTILLGTLIGLDDATFMLALVPVLLLPCSIVLGLAVVLRNVSAPEHPAAEPSEEPCQTPVTGPNKTTQKDSVNPRPHRPAPLPAVTAPDIVEDGA